MKNSFLYPLYSLLSVIFSGLITCPIMGQVPAKKQLIPADYHLWHTMENAQLSDKGTWASYRFSYESADTTFMVHTKTLKKFIFPNSAGGLFNAEESFSYLTKGGLMVIDLNSGAKQSFPNVRRYEFSADGQFLVTLENTSSLLVRKKGKVLERIENVAGYEWNNDRSKLVYAVSENGNGSVGAFCFKEKYTKRTIASASKQAFEVFKWQPSGNAVAFYGTAKGSEQVYYYDFKSQRTAVLKSSDARFPEKMKIDPNQNIALKVSRDGKKVFFGMTAILAKDTALLPAGIEVWNAKDQLLYRDRKLRAAVSRFQFLAVWFIEDGLVQQISSHKQSWTALNGSQDYALVADQNQYEPRYKWMGDMDYYLMNLKTAEKELVLKQQSGYDNQMDFSPDGRFISYYKNGGWWVYDIDKKSHTSITKGLKVNWDNSFFDPGERNIFGRPGWTKDSRYILLYDYNDLWAITPDGKERKRLTNGKERQLQFRLDDSAISNIHEFNFSDTGTAVYDLSIRAVLTSYNLQSGAKGFYTLYPGHEPQSLVTGDASLTKYKKAKKSEAFIYVIQRFDSSPALMFENKGHIKAVVQSNIQQKRYYWGRSELINYTDSKGNPLKGALYYPAPYDVNQKYPMVVFIYETLSKYVNDYVNPTLHNGIGFNITNLTADGYAVLLPDIAYERGNSALSAADCVTAAVEKVIEMGVADPKRIGLAGQSFGGYEVNFIITRTNMFAAAVSGSAVSDNVQHYFTINTIYNTIDGWRYENQQYRMGFPFFENQQAYFRNSPLLNAGKISTPLLTWAGKADQNVQPLQAETFYAALRRLGKEHVMLVYDNEDHIFNHPKNQQDLTLKINDWFGHYLKGAPKADWMKADIEK